uniref:F-box domain-containing protein n=1 Tax=Meloidogyne incognita TaxID=6306 RepID=A0A914LVY3_MELIC
MFFLPTEAKLDVLKWLNFDQLTSFKLSNSFFLNLINKYEGELCFRIKFNQISLEKLNFNSNDVKKRLKRYKIINPESELIEYTLNDRLVKKWQRAIDIPIPLYLHKRQTKKISDKADIKLAICLHKIIDRNKRSGIDYFLELPNIPKNFKELAIIKFWLKQLFNCVFKEALINRIVFNPEMLNILFCDDKTIPPQLNIQYTQLFVTGPTFKNIWNFVSNHLTISEILYLHFTSIFGVDFDNLLNILTNEGSKLPIVSFQFSGNDLNFLIHLCNLIIKVSYPGHTFSSWPIYISFVDPLQYESIYTGCLVELNRLAPKSI